MKRVLFVLLAALSFGVARAEVLGDYEVKVRPVEGEWRTIETFRWQVDKTVGTRHQAADVSIAKFDFEGEVEVSVTSLRGDVDSVRIRPLSFGITPKLEGRTVSFRLSEPRYLSVEMNGEIFGNLHLFADAPLQKPKKSRGRRIISFGPGVHKLEGDSLAIPSNTTVWIDKDAVIKGWLSVWRAHDVKIIGHGIVDPGRHEGIMVKHSSNVEIDGLLTTQIPVGGSRNVSVRNAKAISWYNWGDGMNVFASRNVSYHNVFCRTSDDCSTIYCTRNGYAGSCDSITVERAIYWADTAHPIMIGLHGDTARNETITNVVYRDIDILDQAENQIDYQGCIAINNGDNIRVSGLLFDNIRIESIRKGMLFNFRVCYNKKYCAAPGRGIDNVTVSNLTYSGAEPNISIITGYDESRPVGNITFRNLRINGLHVSDGMAGRPRWYKTSDMARIFVGEHVGNVVFEE